MAKDVDGNTISLGDRLAVGLSAGMYPAEVVDMPSGLSMPGQQPGQIQFMTVVVLVRVPVNPDGSTGVVKGYGSGKATETVIQ